MEKKGPPSNIQFHVASQCFYPLLAKALQKATPVCTQFLSRKLDWLQAFSIWGGRRRQ